MGETVSFDPIVWSLDNKEKCVILLKAEGITTDTQTQAAFTETNVDVSVTLVDDQPITYSYRRDLLAMSDPKQPMVLDHQKCIKKGLEMLDGKIRLTLWKKTQIKWPERYINALVERV